MPAAPLWIHRLPDTLPALASLPQDLIGRRTLQELLVVGKWTAGRILRQCGADEGPGGALVCPCDALVERLRVIQQDGRCTTEIARPERVELYLDGITPENYSREILTQVFAHSIVSWSHWSPFARLSRTLRAVSRSCALACSSRRFSSSSSLRHCSR